MGLDVRYYSNLKLCTNQGAARDVYFNIDAERIVRIRSVGFPERLDDIPDNSFWELTDSTEEGNFYAGGYGGYSSWRERLSQLFLGSHLTTVWNRPNDFLDRPFVELINFNDSEGAIGPKTSAKLARDFVQHESEAADVSGLITTYRRFGNAFSVAQNRGVVIFC